MIPRKRGRPVSEGTIEKRRIKELLENPPAHVRPMSEGERREIDCMLDSFGKVEKEILRQYRTSATIPKSHAYEMASLGDEALQGFESAIVSRDQQYQVDAGRARSKGGQARGEEPSFRAQKVAEINKDLIEKVKSGEMRFGEAARRIHDRWETRGAPGFRQPSKKTLERDIRRVVSER